MPESAETTPPKAPLTQSEMLWLMAFNEKNRLVQDYYAAYQRAEDVPKRQRYSESHKATVQRLRQQWQDAEGRLQEFALTSVRRKVACPDHPDSQGACVYCLNEVVAQRDAAQQAAARPAKVVVTFAPGGVVDEIVCDRPTRVWFVRWEDGHAVLRRRSEPATRPEQISDSLRAQIPDYFEETP